MNCKRFTNLVCNNNMAFIIKSYCDNGTTTFASDQRRGTMLKYAHF